MRAGFLIVILPRKAQVHVDSALVLLNANSTKGFLDRFPADVTGCVRSQHRSVQVIGVQVMVLGLFASQLMFSNVGLPDRVGAPQSLLACCGVKAVAHLLRWLRQPYNNLGHEKLILAALNSENHSSF